MPAGARHDSQFQVRRFLILFKPILLQLSFACSLNLMICCLASVEYDRYSFLATENDISTLWVVSLGFQLLVQIGVTITLYIMMFDTYPFRVGLMV